MFGNLCKGDKWPLGMVTGFFMLTVGVSTILALTVSQQAAYLWLSFVLIGVLFLTTFTRAARTPIAPFLDSIPNNRQNDRLDADRLGPAPPYYVRIDPPPSYVSATATTVTIYPDNCEPPPYINVVIQNARPTTPPCNGQIFSKLVPLPISIPNTASPCSIINKPATAECSDNISSLNNTLMENSAENERLSCSIRQPSHSELHIINPNICPHPVHTCHATTSTEDQMINNEALMNCATLDSNEISSYSLAHDYAERSSAIEESPQIEQHL